MRITPTLIESGKSLRGGWNRQQVELLGESWPLMDGWQERACKRSITPENAERFLELRGTTQRKTRRSPLRTELPFPAGFPAKHETAIGSFHLYLSRLDRAVLREALPVINYMLAKARDRAKP